jgi:hypothetical protein
MLESHACELRECICEAQMFWAGETVELRAHHVAVLYSPLRQLTIGSHL